MDLRPVLHLTGLLLSVLALGMLAPLLADFADGNPDWKIFLLCAGVTAFFSGLLVLTSAAGRRKVTPRQGFVMAAASLPALCLFAALPFWLGGQHLSITDSLFEAVSGLTTTGATALTGLDAMPHGILLWRAALQWLGGLGMIVLALTLLPSLRAGGMQMFRAALPDPEKNLPRIARLTAAVAVSYTVLTLLCLLAYHFAGLDFFDALAHALATLSSGGFSTHDDALAHFALPGPAIVATVFALAGSLPLVLYGAMARGDALALLRDSQVRWFLAVAAAGALLLAAWLVCRQGQPPVAALWNSLYHAIAALTGTGYAVGDGAVWRGFPAGLFFLLIAVGGCAGSTAGGLKIFRFRILLSQTGAQLKKLLHPHGVFLSYYNGRPVADGVTGPLPGFFFLYAMTFIALSAALSFAGLDTAAALVHAATSLANASPSSLPGIAAGVADFPDSAKWVMIAGMLIGRVEILPLLVLLAPAFWRR